MWWLRPSSIFGNVLLALGGGLVALAVVLGALAVSPPDPLLPAAGLAAVVGGIFALLGLRRRAAIEVRCDRRYLTTAIRGLAGLGQRRVVPLVDIDRAECTALGWLILYLHDDSRAPIQLDARHHEHHHLEPIADVITEAARTAREVAEAAAAEASDEATPEGAAPTEAPYRLDHEGMTCTIRPRSPAGRLLVVSGVGSAGGGAALGVIALALQSASLAAGAAAALPLGLALGWAGLRQLAIRRLQCRRRTLTLTILGPGGLGSRPLALSMIDLHRVAVTSDGWLVIEPDPGPLSPVWIDARGQESHELEVIASAITAAADQAEAHRGDYPDAATREVRRLVEGRAAPRVTERG